MVFFISISLISALIFMISFLLLTLGLVCSSLSSCFRCNVSLFIWAFSCFLRWDCIAINFLLRKAFAASHRFWSAVSLLSFASRYFLISSLISLVNHWLFSLHVFVFFAVFFLLLISSHIALWSEKMLDMISIFLKLRGLICSPGCGQS